MRRRAFFAGLGGLTLAGGAFTFRWHSFPQRKPLLTNAHLQGLINIPLSTPRVLFIGNSMVLNHDLPARVANRAAREGVGLQVVTAAARGARLIETQRIGALGPVLDLGWDALILQDFSTVSLRAPDRWGSVYAMRTLARRAKASAVLLYPTWAPPASHRIYHGGGPLGGVTPQDPADFAARITAHYDGIAEVEGWRRAPVTEAMAPDPTDWLNPDLHHLNAVGADHVAGVLWDSLRNFFS